MHQSIRRKRPPSHRGFKEVTSTCNISAFLLCALLQYGNRFAIRTPRMHTAPTTGLPDVNFFCGHWHDLAVFLHRHGCEPHRDALPACTWQPVSRPPASGAALLKVFAVPQQRALKQRGRWGQTWKARTSAWRAVACGGTLQCELPTCSPHSSGVDEHGQAEHSPQVRGWVWGCAGQR